MRRRKGENNDDPAPSTDRLSAGGGGARKAVHPYRDRRETLIARRRDLARELKDAEKAAARRDRLARHLEVIDDELDDQGTPTIDAITIRTPCRARWEAMRGDDVVRHCGRCHRDVYDLSRMTRPEIEALFARAERTPCVRLRRRPDGRVVTADCPSEQPSAAARAFRMVTAGVIFGASAGAAAAITASPRLVTPWVPRPAEVQPPQRESAPRVQVRRLRTASAESSGPSEGDGIADMLGQAVIDPRPASPTSPSAADLDAHIRWIAPQAYEIDRALVEELIENRPMLMRAARVIPHEENGEVIGVKLYGIRRLSLLGRLGIQNGDSIRDINGAPLASPGEALETYARLRDADALFVRVVRRGSEMMLVYRITS